jgi:hypothetical protein
MKALPSLYGKKLWVLPILLLLALSLLNALNVNITRVSAVVSPYIAVVPDTIEDVTMTPGTNFTVSIYTDYVGTSEYLDYIWGYQFALSYNPNVLHGGINNTDTWAGDGATTIFNTTQVSIVPNSEKIYVNQILMTKLSNYTIDYKEGKITLLTTTETWIGTNTTTVFYTAQKPIVPDSEKVYVNKTLMTKPWEYAIDYDKGEITFATAPDLGVEIKVAYQYPPALGAEIKAIYLYNGVVNGDLIVGGSAQLVPGPFDNVAGELSLTVGVFTEGGEVTSGPGTLANVTFTVVGYGASDITIDPQSKLVGWNWFGDPYDYDIINAETMPDQIQHGYFRNIPPVHDVAVSLVAPDEAVVGQLVAINVTVVAPDEAVVGQLVAINVTVANMGTYHENVTLTVSYDDTPINTTTFTLTLAKKGLNETFSFSWNTAGLAPIMYTLNATANIPLDDLPADNTKTRLITLEVAHDVLPPMRRSLDNS